MSYSRLGGLAAVAGDTVLLHFQVSLVDTVQLLGLGVPVDGSLQRLEIVTARYLHVHRIVSPLTNLLPGVTLAALFSDVVQVQDIPIKTAELLLPLAFRKLALNNLFWFSTDAR